jgi:zinc protease
VERVREQQRRQLEVARKQNGWWMGTIRSRLEEGEPLATLLTSADARRTALTPAALHAAAQRYFTEANRIRFVLLPEGMPEGRTP